MSRHSPYREPMLKHVRVARQWHRLMLDCQWMSEHGRARKLRLLMSISIQLAWAFPDPVSGFAGSFVKFAGIFAITQVPLAISEGLLTVVVCNAMRRFNAGELRKLKLIDRAEVHA